MERIRTLILGATGRDFHNFNVVYRDDTRYEVVGFTAAQIPNIAGRRYPADLAGPLYTQGVPIFPEEDLPRWSNAWRSGRSSFPTATCPTPT